MISAASRSACSACSNMAVNRISSAPAAAIAGTPADCVAAVREVAAAGAELILFTAMFEQAEHAERLAAEIIPQLG